MTVVTSKRIIAAVLAVLSLLCSCAGRNETKNDDFVIRWYTDKNSYKDGEKIACHVTVQYIGDKEQFAIYTGDPVVGFSLRGGPGLDVHALYSQILQPTLFKRGETKQFEFLKTGAYNEDSPAVLKEYLSRKELALHPGKYTITAELDYSTDHDNVIGTKKTLHASIPFSVT